MTKQQPVVTDARGKRKFACSPAAVIAFIVNPKEEILLLSHPKRAGKWEPVNGALEAEETILQGVLREIREEAGEQARVRPLGAIHVYTFPFDPQVQYMISICYLLAYEGGAVVPGDDMVGSAVRWAGVDEIESGAVNVILPSKQGWVYRRAAEMYTLLKERPALELQPPLSAMRGNKYDAE